MTEQDNGAPEPGENEGIEPIDQDAPGAAEPDAESAPAWAKDDEEEARLFGWKPETEWKGDIPPTFEADPARFLDRVKNSRTFKAMEERQESIRRELEADRQRAMERQKAAFQARLQSVQQGMRQAVETADTAEYDRLSQEQQRLMEYAPQVQPEAPQGPDPDVQAYAQSPEGQWVNDPAIRAIGFDVIEKNPHVKHLPAKDQIRFAELQLRKDYPHLFSQPQPEEKRKTSARVDGGGLGSRSGGGAWQKLPAEAREQFKKEVRKGLFKDDPKDREEYANEYLSL